MERPQSIALRWHILVPSIKQNERIKPPPQCGIDLVTGRAISSPCVHLIKRSRHRRLVNGALRRGCNDIETGSDALLKPRPLIIIAVPAAGGELGLGDQLAGKPALQIAAS